MRFYERFCSFRALCIIGKCTSRHLFAYGELETLEACIIFCILRNIVKGERGNN